MAQECPFDPKDDQSAYVVILAEKPGKKSVDALMAFRSESDDFVVQGKEAYNLRRNREKSIFTNHSMEQVLGILGTARNMTTIRKLAEKYA